jgi:hypothetical protein
LSGSFFALPWLWFFLLVSSASAALAPAKEIRQFHEDIWTTDQVLIGGQAVDTAAAFEAPPGRGDLEFRYSAPNLQSPQRMEFVTN